MGVWIGAAALFGIAAALLVMGVRSFMEKGFLFNNAWIWASRAERERMDKRPHYRQTAIVLMLLSGVFLLNGIGVIVRSPWIFRGVMALLAATLVYGIASEAAIGKKARRKDGGQGKDG